MSFQNTAPCFLTFYHSYQSLLLFEIQIFVLNTSVFTFILHFVVGMIMHGYNMVEPLHL